MGHAKKAGLLAAIVASSLTMSCAQTPVGSGDYEVRDARTVGTVQFGVIEDTRVVRIREKSDRGGVGATAGAVGGAVIGNQVGKGTGRDIATIIGAGAGAAAGSRADQALAQQPGIELLIRLDDGKTIVVTQGADQAFSVGQRVRVMRHGRTYRVTG